MNFKKLEINRAIAEIENNYPSDNLITTYKDFLKYRDYLHFYQYNEAVFVSLIDLIYNLWNTKQRINRASLVTVTKRYFKKAEEKISIPDTTARKIFKLFKEIIYKENLKLSQYTVEEIKKAINSILIGIKLNDNELLWLCNHSNQSKFILNRVLRYHKKSDIITNWAKTNFEKDYARSRRADITSWIIDENPDFKIDEETVVFDFEFQISEDKRLVETFKQKKEIYNFIEKIINPLIYDDEKLFYGELNPYPRIKDNKKPELNLPFRFYNSYLNYNSKYDICFPNFDNITDDFYKRFDYYYKKIMAWSIAYSRLDINTKIGLLSNYFTSELYPSFFVIGKKLKSIEYFQWLKKIALI